ncbi:MAG: hypothetical protein GF346_05765, partial [Candidatus Eisenbacteria bacterium]|nr:hypothetical protein [Candidatus Latescibacterota bacterium]MBD3301935.1 hypothetical protein [Candidatus Eisenbacteria bacterium]
MIGSPPDSRRGPDSAVFLPPTIVAIAVAFFLSPSPADAGASLGQFGGDIACGPFDHECSAYADFHQDNPAFTTDYYGDVTLDVDWYFATSGFWCPGEDDFYAQFDCYVDGSNVKSKYIHWSCSATGNGKVDFPLTSSNGTTTYSVKLKSHTWGEGENCNAQTTKTVSVTRPKCDTSLTLSAIGNKNQNSRRVTVSGTVADTDCSQSFSDAQSIHVTIEGPDLSEICNTWIDLNNSYFETTCELPDHTDPENYGTYIVNASYTANSPSGHDRLDDGTSDTETFDRKFIITLPSPPQSAGAYSNLDGYRFAVTDWEDWYVYFFELGADVVSDHLDLGGFINSPPRGISIFAPDGSRPQDAILAISQEQGRQIIFLTESGQYLFDLSSPTADPFGLDWQQDSCLLWVADYTTGDLYLWDVCVDSVLRELHPGLGGIADIDYDPSTATLLVLVPDDQQIHRLDPGDGTLLESFPIDPDHYAMTSLNEMIYVADFATWELYPLYEGPPAPPDEVAVHTGPDLPDEIRVTWKDPDPEPDWDRIRIYRDGVYLEDVPGGTEEYRDTGLEEHSYHSYFLCSLRDADAVLSAPSDTVGAYVGRRPPTALHVPGDYATIQAAIHAAADDDTILVGPGTYGAPLYFDGRSVQVLSTAGPEETTIDGDGFPLSVVRCDSTEGPGTRFAGFTVRGGNLRHGTGVIRCGPDASPTIGDNVITDNDILYEGGGIVCVGGGTGNAVIEGNTIAMNRVVPDTLALFTGGGIACFDASPVIRNNIIASNDSCSYGIYNDGGDPQISCNVVWDSFLEGYFGCDPGDGDIAEDPLFCAPGSYDLRLCADSPCLDGYGCGRIGGLGEGCDACGSTLDYADHDAGDLILTVTDQGILGFMDGTQTQGSGLVYPADTENRLHIGGLWIAEGPDYVASRDYDADPDKEWVVSSAPNGHVWIDESGHADQVIHARCRDDAAADPRGLYVRQESWAFARPDPALDFVILQYTVRNDGVGALEDLYGGVFLDIDIGGGYANTGSVDEGLSLVYVDQAGGIHVGVSRLEADGVPPPANLTLVHNPTFVYPQEYVLDADKHGFLAASDPEHILRDAPDPDDYGVVASVGPFTLQPEEEVLLAFALVGGESLEDLLANAEVAQLAFAPGITDAPSADLD